MGSSCLIDTKVSKILGPAHGECSITGDYSRSQGWTDEARKRQACERLPQELKAKLEKSGGSPVCT